MFFPLAYLHLTLAHSIGQGQSHAILIANILYIVTDWANITLTVIRKAVYGLSICIITIDLKVTHI